MAKLDTGAFSAATTQSEATGQREIKVGDAAVQHGDTTGLYRAAGSVPLDLPEIAEAEGHGYVFRIGGSPRSGKVTIKLDTKQLMEQARVRKINQAIRRARQR